MKMFLQELEEQGKSLERFCMVSVRMHFLNHFLMDYGKLDFLSHIPGL